MTQYATVLAIEYNPLGQYSDKGKQRLFASDPDAIMRKVAAWAPQSYLSNWFCQSGHAVSTIEAFPQTKMEPRRKDFRKIYGFRL